MSYVMNALLHYAGVAYRRGYITATEYDTILAMVIKRHKNYIN